jgi:CTP:molybdopterin cytidylyltransferase MocA
VVLAAGASTRLGAPKVLLEFGASTALEILLATLASAGVTRGVVVLGDDAGSVQARVDATPLSFVRNVAPGRGRVGSLQCGLAALPANSDVLLWPADRPFADAATVLALLATRERLPRAYGSIVPRDQGRRGHPILVSSVSLRHVEAAPPDASLRDVFRRAGVPTIDVPVDDEGIHVNLDTADDYERALAWWRGRR